MHDRTSTGFDHQGNAVPRDQVRPPKVDTNDPVEDVGPGIDDGLPAAMDARTGNQDLNKPELPNRLVDGLPTGVIVSHIAESRHRRTVAGLYFACDVLSPVSVDVSYTDRRPFSREFSGASLADARGAAGDKGNPTRKTLHLVHLLDTPSDRQGPAAGHAWAIRLSEKRNWGRQDSNPRPSDYESPALTTELRPRSENDHTPNRPGAQDGAWAGAAARDCACKLCGEGWSYLSVVV